MTRSLLVRGMLTGLIAGLILFAFARLAGEPQVDGAIAFESSQAAARGDAPEPEMVSRRMQSGLGLLTGAVMYSTALGGIFGLVFAFAQGRFGVQSARGLAVWIAGLGFVSIVLVPSLKYPANPPAVGTPETIGVRTAAYFLAIAFSVASMALAVQLGRRLRTRWGAWDAALVAVLAYLALVGTVAIFLPAIDEVPANFPASLLWKFRIASWGMQLLLWSTLGLVFGWLTDRAEGLRARVR